jgi:hypothetical protein
LASSTGAGGRNEEVVGGAVTVTMLPGGVGRGEHAFARAAAIGHRTANPPPLITHLVDVRNRHDLSTTGVMGERS